MKHEVINVDDPDSFKESILDVIEYTPHMLADVLADALHQSGVDEGVRKSIWCFSQLFEGHPVAYCEFDVTSRAEAEWKKRIAICVGILRTQKRFHVEHTWAECIYRDLKTHKIWIAYEHSRSI